MHRFGTLQAFAIFYTKIHDRVLAPLFTAGRPPAPPQLRDALRTIQQVIDDRLASARLPVAALTNSAQPSESSTQRVAKS